MNIWEHLQQNASSEYYFIHEINIQCHKDILFTTFFVLVILPVINTINTTK